MSKRALVLKSLMHFTHMTTIWLTVQSHLFLLGKVLALEGLRFNTSCSTYSLAPLFNLNLNGLWVWLNENRG